MMFEIIKSAFFHVRSSSNSTETNTKKIKKLRINFCHRTHGRREIAVNQTINNPEGALDEDKNRQKVIYYFLHSHSPSLSR